MTKRIKMDTATSLLFQLDRLAALSEATVVAKVSPSNFSAAGAGVAMLTTTNTRILNKNR